MKALLLSAGLGTRLAPLTNTIPKCLVPIGGIPLIDYWLAQLIPSGFDNILINTHHLSETVQTYLKKSPWKNNIHFSYEETLLGTGGTLLKNRYFFESDTFLVAHADNLTALDLPSFLHKHKNRPAGIEITMATFITDTPETCGIVEVDERGIVKKFHEKTKNPPGNQANGAIYLMEPTIFRHLEDSSLSVIDISLDLIPLYLEKIQIWHNSYYLRDIGSMTSLVKANQDILEIIEFQKLRENIFEAKGKW